MKGRPLTRRSIAFLAFVLVTSSLPVSAAGPASERGTWCGTVPGRARNAVWTHREAAARRGPVALSARDTSYASGQVAVLIDEGDIALSKNILDLFEKSLTFTPVPGGYGVARSAVALSPDPGTPIPFADDDSRALALPFAFPFYGQSYTSLFVNSDGNLTFAEGDVASTPRRIGRLLGGPPRIAPLLTDLDPSKGGAVSYRDLGDRFVVTWDNMPEFEGTGKDTFQALLYPSGRIDFVYARQLNGNLEEGVVGIAPGHEQGDFLPVHFSAAAGQISGGAIAESFRLDDTIDTLAAARKYYRSFPDEVQQLVVFTSKSLVGGDTFAYENTVKNDASGIGDGLYDDSAEYGSAGHLESFVMMDTINQYPEDPHLRFLGEDSSLSLLAHEVGHRWLAYARFKDGAAISDAILGRQLAHWSFFMNSSGSHLEGNEIQDLGGGQFKTIAASVRYGPLDQYLMGLRAADEVPGFFLVTNVPSSFGTRERKPEVGITFTGTRRDLGVADVIAALGPRTPPAGRAPTSIRQSFVFVSVGRDPTPDELEKVERLRSLFPAFYAASTDGRGEADPRIN